MVEISMLSTAIVGWSAAVVYRRRGRNAGERFAVHYRRRGTRRAARCPHADDIE
jgi:hypothetical protein